MSGPFIKTEYNTAGSYIWSWPGVESAAEAWIWSGGAGGEGSIPSDRGGAGGSGGGFTKVTVCRGTNTEINITVGAGGDAGAAGEDSFISQDGIELARVSGAAACTADADGGYSGSAGHGDFDGGRGANNAIQHTMFGDIPYSDHGGDGGSSAGPNHIGYDGEPTLVGTAPQGGGAGGHGGQPPDGGGGGATDGEDAPGRGGGGGGGGKGKVSGKGHAGEVWIICPVPTAGGRCCCDSACPACVTRESLGLPETISASFGSVSVTDDGMPVDEETGEGCVDGPQSNYRWSVSSALAGLLNGDFAFLEQTEVGGCCFRYRAVGSYDPPECGDGATGQRMVSNPYPPSGVGAYVQKDRYSGNCKSWSEVRCDSSPVPAPSCEDFCGIFTSISDGTLYVPLPIFGTGDLLICIAGDTVTIRVSIEATIPCRTYSGTNNYNSATSGATVAEGTPGPGCVEELLCDAAATCFEPDFTPCDEGTADCSIRAGGGVGWQATADLSGTPGDTIWDKIQAYDWEGTYGEQSCSCAAGGCAASWQTTTCECECLPVTCFCAQSNCTTESGGSETAVDVPCLYGSGTASGAFS